MDQIWNLQQLEYLETGFEVSKILAKAGHRMETPVFQVTWGQVAEILAQTLADHGLTPDRIEEDLLLEMAQAAVQALGNDEIHPWREILRNQFRSNPVVTELSAPLDMEDDEGPLTELYENATRLGDDEAYWVDGGASADLFDDF